MHSSDIKLKNTPVGFFTIQMPTENRKMILPVFSQLAACQLESDDENG